jgi:peptidyl-prolyl cis-trans isomerase B (cyclophilin B)
MRLLILAAVLAGFAPQDPPAQTLKLTLTADKNKLALGQEIQFEVKLENAGDKDVDLAVLEYEQRSFSLAVTGTFTALGERKKEFTLAISRPEPQVAEKLPLPRMVLGARKSVNLIHRVTTVGVGSFDFTAKYAGGAAEVSSAPVKVEVEATNQGGRLAAVVEIEEAGPFRIILSPEVSPSNVTHLASLISRGFYTGNLVHRIVKNSWVQMGCPYGIGIGGPGYAVKAELDKTFRHEAGTVSMSGYEKTGHTGSQFFICLSPHPSLDGKYSPVGRVENDDMGKIVEPIGKKETDRNTDAPKTPIKIKTITLTVVK